MTSSMPTLERMPTHVKRMIFEQLKTSDKCSCRLVSKSIKSGVEETLLKVYSVRLAVNENEVWLSAHHVNKMYTNKRFTCIVDDYSYDFSSMTRERRETRCVPGWKNAHFAVDDFKKFWASWPRIQVKRLEVVYEGSKHKKFKPLKKLVLAQFDKMIPDGSLNVRKLELDNDMSNAELQMVLKKMKKLEVLELSHSNHDIHPYLQRRYREMKGFVDLDVFKQLRVFKSEYQTVKGLDIKKLMHLDEFIIASEDVSLEDVEILKKECLQKCHKQFEITCPWYQREKEGRFKSSLEPAYKEDETVKLQADGHDVEFVYYSSFVKFNCNPRK